jgi:hypothetical protein
LGFWECSGSAEREMVGQDEIEAAAVRARSQIGLRFSALVDYEAVSLTWSTETIP